MSASLQPVSSRASARDGQVVELTLVVDSHLRCTAQYRAFQAPSSAVEALGKVALSEKGVFALVQEDLLPVTQEILADAEGACDFSDGVALLGDELDSLGLELWGVGASRSRH